MAQLVDALVSGASVERRAGSSPVLGTKYKSDLANTQSIDCIPYKTKSKVTFDLRGGMAATQIRRAHFIVASQFRRSAGGEIGIHATLRG